MTRKHYIEIARILDENTIIIEGNEDRQYLNKSKLIKDLCAMFAEDNERFSRPRFIDACFETKSIDGMPLSNNEWKLT